MRSRPRRISLQGRPVLRAEIFPFADADAMLAGTGSLHLDGSQHHAFIERRHRIQFSRAVRVDQKNNVEVAVAHMSDDGGQQTRGGNIGAGLRDTLGKT